MQPEPLDIEQFHLDVLDLLSSSEMYMNGETKTKGDHAKILGKIARLRPQSERAVLADKSGIQPPQRSARIEDVIPRKKLIDLLFSGKLSRNMANLQKACETLGQDITLLSRLETRGWVKRLDANPGDIHYQRA